MSHTMNLFAVILLTLQTEESLAKNVIGNSQLVSLKSNKILRASDVSEKPLIMDFWATWCESCRKNLETIDGLLGRKKTKTKIVFVNIDEEGPGVVRAFFELPELKLSLLQVKSRTYWDKQQTLGNKLAKNGIPYLVVFDGNGKKIYEHDGIVSESDWTKLNAAIAYVEKRL